MNNVQTLKPRFWRRGIAALLDQIFLTTFIALGVWFFTPFSIVLTENGVLKYLEQSPAVMRRLEQSRAAAEKLGGVVLTEAEQKFLQSWLESDTWKEGLSLEVTNPQALMEALPQVLDKIKADFTRSLANSGLPPESLKRIGDFALTLQNALTTLQPLELVADLLEFLRELIFIPLVLALSYGAIEALLGASPGKIVVGLTVAQVSGQRGNVLTFFARYLLKNLTSGLVLAAILASLWPLFLAAGVVGLIYGFSYLGLLGGKRQTLYDKLAGTSVFDSKEVYESLTQSPD